MQDEELLNLIRKVKSDDTTNDAAMQLFGKLQRTRTPMDLPKYTAHLYRDHPFIVEPQSSFEIKMSNQTSFEIALLPANFKVGNISGLYYDVDFGEGHRTEGWSFDVDGRNTFIFTIYDGAGTAIYDSGARGWNDTNRRLDRLECERLGIHLANECANAINRWIEDHQRELKLAETIRMNNELIYLANRHREVVQTARRGRKALDEIEIEIAEALRLEISATEALNKFRAHQ